MNYFVLQVDTISLHILRQTFFLSKKMFKQLVHEKVEGNKHVPQIIINENHVQAVCKAGNDYHPMTQAHYIQWIKIYGQTQNDVVLELASTQFYPEHCKPQTEVELLDIKKYKKIIAVSMCNVHGIYENEVTL